MQSRNYLVIGQGLAGTLISFELLRRGISHKVLDQGHQKAATKAAAGIINPITGRRYVKSWRMEELLSAVEPFYNSIGALLKKDFLRKTTIIRSFDNLTQEKTWFESTARPGYSEFIKPKVELASYQYLVNEAFGYGEIDKAYKVNISELITAYRSFLIDKKMLIEMPWDHQQFNYDSKSFRVDDEDYTDLIFCEGSKVINNPLFNTLPWQPSKGEAFIVKLEEELPEKLLRDKIYITPIDKHSFWTGGGFENEQLTHDPTEDFRNKWGEKLKSLLKVNFSISNHLAGIRPSVSGRRPIIGTHQQFSNLHIFNGMGTKGTSLGPFFAKQFVASLLSHSSIDQEVNLNRFNY